jgi:diguanylate cyclase (GGDEF)-like protein
MRIDPEHGNILVITDDPEAGERIVRWISAVGETPVLLAGAERFLIREGDDETVDLLVTDLDTDDPEAHRLLERLVSGDLFPGVPQIHILRDLAFQARLQSWDSSVAAMSVHAPPEAGDFQCRVRLAAEVGRLRRELTRSSVRDDLTNLFNRRYFLMRLEEEISRAHRYRTHVSLILFDIDHLREINRRHGEPVGDLVIREVGHILLGLRRKPDIVGRIGEETFGMILPATRFRGAATLANKVRTDVQNLDLHDADSDEIVEVRISGGISAFPDDSAVKHTADLTDRADRALGEAKKRGGNRIYIDEGTIRGMRKMVLIADPDRALLDQAEDLLGMDDFRVVRAETSVEALETLRFRTPDLLIVDLQMPGREDDLLLIERIRALHPGPPFPIIGLSRESGLRAAEMQNMGVDRFITKPFSVSLLLHVARELVQEKS